MPATSGGRPAAMFRRKTRGTVTVRMTTVLLAVAALCFLGPRVSRAAGPRFEGLPYLAGEAHHSGANGVSADGSVVVGFARAGDHSRAVRWEAGRVERVGFLPGEAQSEANAVSADGSVVVGRAYISSTIPEVRLHDRAFRWHAGAVADLGALGPPNGVSGDGSVVVGSASSAASATSPATTALAFAWSNGAMRGLGDVPGGDFYSHATDVSRDGAVVVGGGVVAGTGPEQKYEAFRWTAQRGMVGLGDLPGGESDSIAWAADADGSVVVGFGSTAAGRRPFRWEDGVMRDLGELAGAPGDAVAFAVSGDGSVVVGAANHVGPPGAGTGTAFVWDETHGMRDLKTVLTSDLGLDLTGWRLYGASGISADGLTIVGNGLNPAGERQAWVARLPEPGLALAPLAGAVVLLRRNPRCSRR